MTDTPKWVENAVHDIEQCINEYDTMGRFPTPDQLEAIITKYCPDDKGVGGVLMETLNFVNGMLGADAFEKERLKNLIKLAIAKRGMKLGETVYRDDKAEKLVEVLRGIKDMAKRYGTISEEQSISKEQYGGKYGNQTVGEYQWALRQLSDMACAALAEYEELNK